MEDAAANRMCGMEVRVINMGVVICGTERLSEPGRGLLSALYKGQSDTEKMHNCYDACCLISRSFRGLCTSTYFAVFVVLAVC